MKLASSSTTSRLFSVMDTICSYAVSLFESVPEDVFDEVTGEERLDCDTVGVDLDEVGGHQGHPDRSVFEGEGDPLGLLRRDLEGEDGLDHLAPLRRPEHPSGQLRGRRWGSLAFLGADVLGDGQHGQALEDEPGVGHTFGRLFGRGPFGAGGVGGDAEDRRVDRDLVELDVQGDDQVDQITRADKAVDATDRIGRDRYRLLARRNEFGERLEVDRQLGPLALRDDLVALDRADRQAAADDSLKFLISRDRAIREIFDVLLARCEPRGLKGQRPVGTLRE